MSLQEDLHDCVDQVVVLDTMEHLLYLGTLTQITENGFWLADADVHDCRDGHAGKEAYVAEARLGGLSANRARVFVMRSAVCSVSRLDDVPAGPIDDPAQTGRSDSRLTMWSNEQ